MTQENKQIVTVQSGGKIEVAVPEFPPGTEVEITVTAKPTTSSKDRPQGRKAQEIVRHHVPKDIMLSEELIRERREESERE